MLKLLGKGSYGSVWLCRLKSELCACKVMEARGKDLGLEGLRTFRTLTQHTRSPLFEALLAMDSSEHPSIVSRSPGRRHPPSKDPVVFHACALLDSPPAPRTHPGPDTQVRRKADGSVGARRRATRVLLGQRLQRRVPLGGLHCPGESNRPGTQWAPPPSRRKPNPVSQDYMDLGSLHQAIKQGSFLSSGGSGPLRMDWVLASLRQVTRFAGGERNGA